MNGFVTTPHEETLNTLDTFTTPEFSQDLYPASSTDSAGSLRESVRNCVKQYMQHFQAFSKALE